MDSDGRWEPPDARKLLITVRRFAELIDVPLYTAYMLSHVLERVHPGPEGVHIRLTVASVAAFRELLEQGLTPEQARDVMAGQRDTARPPAPAPPPVPPRYDTTRSAYRRSRHRWR